jgi:hypothetical protein
METKRCTSCKLELPIEKFENHKFCRKCYKQDYYKRNRKAILSKSKAYKEIKLKEKKEAGTYKWGSSQKSEEEKFNFFIEKHNIVFENE